MKNLLRIYFICEFILFTIPCNLFAQGRGDTWCFGDSVTLSLQAGAFVNQSSCNLNSMEASASISDNNGNLLFYCGSSTNSSYGYLKIWNSNHQLLQNGDSILGHESVTNGLIILPSPIDTNKYYVISRIITIGFSLYLYYSIVDMSLNSGNGAVILKNVLLFNHILTEKLAAIKHGNGRDWWIIIHQFSFSNDNNTFSIFLLTPNGITGPINQSIGSFYNHNTPYNGFYGEMQPSNDGNRLLCVSTNIIDLFDFDRCSGVLSNYQNLAPTNPAPPLNSYYGCSFSNNSNKIYISNWDGGITLNTRYKLFQLDLLATNIPSSKKIIFSTTNQNTAIGQHQLARNGKIYIASTYGISFPNNNYTNQNMNLSVINFPDSTGLSCDFSAYSVPLAGRRCYYGLPNIPNYNLGADEGSVCDTITTVNNLQPIEKDISVYPNPTNDYLIINYNFQNSKSGIFSLHNSFGQKVISKNLSSSSTSLKLNLENLSKGVYFWTVESVNHLPQTGKIIIVK